MDIKRYTPVPPISASATEADNSEDPEMREEMEEWRQRVETLVKTENFEEVVSNNNYRFESFCRLYGFTLTTSLSVLCNVIFANEPTYSQLRLLGLLLLLLLLTCMVRLV